MSIKKMGVYVLLTIVLIVGIGLVGRAAPDGMRSWLCDVFLCDAFIGLNARVETIDSKVDAVMDLVSQSNSTELARKVDLLLLPENSVWIEIEREGQKLYVEIWIKGETLWQTTAFGFGGAPNPGIIYEPTQLTYVGIAGGTLTANWNTIDVNEIQAGQLILGGFAGVGSPIVGKSIGTIARLEFDIAEGAVSFSFDLQNYVDGIENLKPNPYTGIFTP